jgi:hypothetical protein
VATHSFVGLAIIWAGVAMTIWVSRPVLLRVSAATA